MISSLCPLHLQRLAVIRIGWHLVQEAWYQLVQFLGPSAIGQPVPLSGYRRDGAAKFGLELDIPLIGLGKPWNQVTPRDAGCVQLLEFLFPGLEFGLMGLERAPWRFRQHPS